MLRSITPLKVLSDTDNPVCHNEMKTAGAYPYSISWSHADQQYTAHCPGFPGSVSMGHSRETALEGAKLKMATILGQTDSMVPGTG